MGEVDRGSMGGALTRSQGQPLKLQKLYLEVFGLLRSRNTVRLPNGIPVTRITGSIAPADGYTGAVAKASREVAEGGAGKDGGRREREGTQGGPEPHPTIILQSYTTRNGNFVVQSFGSSSENM